MNKSLIKKRFAKNLATYNDNAVVQKRMAEKLCSLLKNSKYEKVLEIGCGTGLLTEILSKQISYKTYIANDLIESCEEYINRIDSNLIFSAGDVEKNVAQNTNKYDLIISNAVFQWIDDIGGLISKLYNSLEDGGCLFFSTFGDENFCEISSILGTMLKYRSRKNFEEILQKYKYEIYEEKIVLDFATPVDVLNHIKKTGVNAISEVHWTKTDMQNFVSKYNNLTENSPKLTYNPLYVVIKK